MTDGATAYDTVNKTRHWEAFLGVGVLTAALFSLKYVKDITRPRLALAVATLIYFSISVSGGFLLAEYSSGISRFIKGIWNLLIAGIEFVGSL